MDQKALGLSHSNIDEGERRPHQRQQRRNEVIDMAFLSIIRRWAVRKHLAIWEIARRMNLSRIEAIAPLGRTMAEAFGSICSRGRLSQSSAFGSAEQTCPFAVKFAGWQKSEAGKSHKQPRAASAPSAAYQAVAEPGVLLRACLLQTHEMLFDAHVHGFRVFEGVPGRTWPRDLACTTHHMIPFSRCNSRMYRVIAAISPSVSFCCTGTIGPNDQWC